MTKPPEPVVTGELKVTQADIKRADDWAYMLGRMGGVILDQSHRKGLAAQFAAHRTASAPPGDVREGAAQIADLIVSPDTAANDIQRQAYWHVAHEAAKLALGVSVGAVRRCGRGGAAGGVAEDRSAHVHHLWSWGNEREGSR